MLNDSRARRAAPDRLNRPINRRHILGALPLVGLASQIAPQIANAAAAPPPTAQAAPAGGFSHADVQAAAAAAAAAPFALRSKTLPASIDKLDYDDYRDIRFLGDHATWKAEGLPFQLQFFHRGGYFREKVEIFEVAHGQARPFAYSTDQFDFKAGKPTDLSPDLGFAGFRIHGPLNSPAYFDEIAVFLGASYFRAVAKYMRYGLSARGLGIGIGEKEEFPDFRAFWIERPAMDAKAITVHALLDSPSCTGAFRFVITPGETTVFDTIARIYPRKTIDNAGFAPLTSMYMWGGEGDRRFDDFRPEVHDSDGLLVVGAAGERAWRPLANPAFPQTSAFTNMAGGYGLLQRQRFLDHYADLESRYELRPDAWVELVGAWQGEVRLLELPSNSEIHDNIGAYWRPAAPLQPGAPVDLAYRLHWGRAATDPALARVVSTRSGLSHDSARRRIFIIDFELPRALANVELTPEATADGGSVHEMHIDRLPDGRGVRLMFQLDPGRNRTAELRALLKTSQTICSEVWLYRWTT